MPRLDHVVETTVKRSPGVCKLLGIFDLPDRDVVHHEWHMDVPLDAKPWNIGLVVGPSGAGKSQCARVLFPGNIIEPYDWPGDASIIDAFDLPIKDAVALLSSVGFSSPPSWLKPFKVLSCGEQFRCTIARAMCERKDLVVVDEFTSVVDRVVAQVGSAAIAKYIRRADRRFVAVTCHYDVLDWLQPDWVLEPHTGRFTWRELQRRPGVDLKIQRVRREAWPLFAPHHYLSADLNKAARCFLGTWNDRPVVFTAVLPLPHAKLRSAWREHRTVCLPDFQGVGVGNAMSDAVGSLARGVGARYYSRTSTPTMIHARMRSKNWNIASIGPCGEMGASSSVKLRPGLLRQSISFEYIGPAADRALSRTLWDERP